MAVSAPACFWSRSAKAFACWMMNALFISSSDCVAMVERLRSLTADDVEAVVEALAPPRWGLSEDEGIAVVRVTVERARSLVQQYEARYYPLIR